MINWFKENEKYISLICTMLTVILTLITVIVASRTLANQKNDQDFTASLDAAKYYFDLKEYDLACQEYLNCYKIDKKRFLRSDYGTRDFFKETRVLINNIDLNYPRYQEDSIKIVDMFSRINTLLGGNTSKIEKTSKIDELNALERRFYNKFENNE